MAGKKDNAVVMVLTDITNAQAAQVAKEVIRIKNKHAPLGRGTIATGKKQGSRVRYPDKSCRMKGDKDHGKKRSKACKSTTFGKGKGF